MSPDRCSGYGAFCYPINGPQAGQRVSPIRATFTVIGVFFTLGALFFWLSEQHWSMGLTEDRQQILSARAAPSLFFSGEKRSADRVGLLSGFFTFPWMFAYPACFSLQFSSAVLLGKRVLLIE